MMILPTVACIVAKWKDQKHTIAFRIVEPTSLNDLANMIAARMKEIVTSSMGEMFYVMNYPRVMQDVSNLLRVFVEDTKQRQTTDEANNQ